MQVPAWHIVLLLVLVYSITLQVAGTGQDANVLFFSLKEGTAFRHVCQTSRIHTKSFREKHNVGLFGRKLHRAPLKSTQ